MVFWSDLHSRRHMLSRTFYEVAGSTTLTMPASAAYLRISGVGAGGTGLNAPSGTLGAGAAFARKKLAVTPGQQFTLQVGNRGHDGNTLADTILTRVSDSVVVFRAKGANVSSPGLASGSIGDVTRDGSAPMGGDVCGDSAGDDGDTFSLGFGGLGAIVGAAGASTRTAGRGGGGVTDSIAYTADGGSFVINTTYLAGLGRACVEIFDQDPAIAWPGY